MRVTPEQSRIVQQTLFNNGYKWKDSSTKVVLEQKTVLCLENCIMWTNEELFEGKNLPELTFQEFFDRYVKWCVMGCVEVSEWASKHFGCHAYVSKDKHLCVLESYSHYSFCDSSEKKLSDYVELTFEQFEKYVLKTKDIEKKIIGYKAPFDLFNREVKAGFIYKPLASKNNKYYAPVNFEDKVGLPHLNLPKEIVEQWEPVYEEEKILYFGKVKFTIKKGYADTEYGKVTEEEISKVFDYIADAPGLVNGKHKLVMPIHDYSKIKFGCLEGTVKELEDIYKAM